MIDTVLTIYRFQILSTTDGNTYLENVGTEDQILQMRIDWSLYKLVSYNNTDKWLSL